MLNLKVKWHYFWREYHFKMGGHAFNFGNFRGAILHLERHLEHNHRYNELTGQDTDFED
jgi:hypothetical protein